MPSRSIVSPADIFVLSKEISKDQALKYHLVTKFHFLGTPFFYYTIFEPGNGTINALFLSLCFVLFYLEVRFSKQHLNWILLGMFHSIAFVVKVDAIFYIFILGEFLYRNIVLDKDFKSLRFLLSFFIGWLIVWLLLYINTILILGNFSYGYGSLFFLNSSVLFDTYFSTYHGVFVNSPLLFMPVVFSILLWKKYKFTFASVWVYLGIGILMKMLVFGMTYTHGSGIFGGRQFIPELPWVALIMLSFFENINFKKPLIKYPLITLISLCIIWNLSLMTLYFAQEERLMPLIPFHDVLSFYYKSIFINPNFLHFLSVAFLNFEDIGTKLANFTFPIFLFFSLGMLTPSRFFKNTKFLMRTLTPMFVGTYALFTVMNLTNTEKNISIYKKEGYFKNALVGRGGLYSTYYENVGSVEERILYLTKRNRSEELSNYQELKDKMNKDVLAEIISYPIDDHKVRDYFREFDSHEKLND